MRRTRTLSSPAEELGAVVARHRGLQHRVGVIGLQRAVAELDAEVTLATLATVDEYAHALYGVLRTADEMGIDVVIAVPPEAVGLGVAVGDRLRRVAAGR